MSKKDEEKRDKAFDSMGWGFDSATGKSIHYKDIITFEGDILYPKYWTEELIKLDEEIEQKLFDIERRPTRPKSPKPYPKALEERDFQERKAVVSQRANIYALVEANYKRQRSKDEIIEDVKLVVGSITKKHYQTHTQASIDFLEAISALEKEKEEPSQEKLDLTRDTINKIKEGFESCFRFVLSHLDIPLRLLSEDEAYTKKIIDIVKARVGLWYTEPESSYLPVLSGRATNLSKFVKSSLLREDPIKKTITLGVGEGEDIIKAVMSKLEETRSKFGISTDKLLQTAIAQFTDNNHVGETSRVLHTREVAIPLKEYAKKNNYDIEEHPTSTPEEAKKEALRVKNTMKDVRKKVNKDLKILATTPLSWKEKVKGKTENYVDVYMLSAKGIVDGYICLKFNEDFASYLIRLPVNQYPVALLGLDERKTTAYLIGKKLSSHFFMDSNQLHNRAQLLKVKTLLKETDLPTLEDVKRIRKSWVDRIKEPFERALDDLGGDYKDENLKDRRGCGLLESWEYCHTKGVPLTDKEKASLIDDFETWSETLIKFTLNDTPDQTDRLETKRAKIEEEKRKKDKKDSQKKPSNKDQ